MDGSSEERSQRTKQREADAAILWDGMSWTDIFHEAKIRKEYAAEFNVLSFFMLHHVGRLDERKEAKGE